MALELTFDLMDLLNSSGKSKAEKRALSRFTKQENIQREFGKRCIDAIKERTLKGKDKRGNAFKRYSKSYKASDDFAIYGKTNKVNLKLTGEMQASIDVVDFGRTTVTIGFISNEQEQKAKGHINGSGPLPVRDFWGLSKDAQLKIFNETVKDTVGDSITNLDEALSAIGAAALEIGVGIVGEEVAEGAAAASVASLAFEFIDMDFEGLADG